MTKEEIVTNILSNFTYMPNAKLMERLHKVLMKLSKDDLSNPAIIIGIKIRDEQIKGKD